MNWFDAGEVQARIVSLETRIAQGFSGPHADVDTKNFNRNLEQSRAQLARLAAGKAGGLRLPPAQPHIAALAPAPTKRKLTRAEALRRLAGSDHEALEAALANGTTVEQFALRQADEIIATRKAAAEAAAVEAVALSIANS